jgi:hypothetical protein
VTASRDLVPAILDSSSREVPDAECVGGDGAAQLDADEGPPQRPASLPRARPATPVPTVMSRVEMAVPVDNSESFVRSRLEPAAKRCYQSSLTKNSTEGGFVNLLLRVLPDGRVASVSVAINTGLSPGVVQCVVSMADSLSFHAPGGNGSVLSVGLALTTRPLSGLEAGYHGVAPDMPLRPRSP